VNISVFPKVTNKSLYPGGLGVELSDENSKTLLTHSKECVSSIINPADGISKRSLIATSSSPLTITSADEIVNSIKEANQLPDIDFYAPKEIAGWIHALFIEADYSCELLKELEFAPYNKGESYLDNGVYSIYNEPIEAGLFATIHKVIINNSDLNIYYVELNDPTQPFPEDLKKADILIVNLVHPTFPVNPASEFEAFFRNFLNVLKENEVRSAFLPTQSGILLSLPTKNKNVLINKPEYEIQIESVKLNILHDRYLTELMDISSAIILENTKKKYLLGLEFGTVLHKRVFNNKLDCNAIVLTANSYHKVFAAIDLIRSVKNEPFLLLCSKAMGVAIEYFMKIVYPEYVDELNKTEIVICDETPLNLSEKYDDIVIEMSQYPNNKDYSIAKIEDLATNERVLFTESIENLDFLEENINNINTLVISVGTLDAKKNAGVTEEIKLLQSKYQIDRIVLLYSNGALISDLDF